MASFTNNYLQMQGINCDNYNACPYSVGWLSSWAHWRLRPCTVWCCPNSQTHVSSWLQYTVNFCWLLHQHVMT